LPEQIAIRDAKLSCGPSMGDIDRRETLEEKRSDGRKRGRLTRYSIYTRIRGTRLTLIVAEKS